MPRRRQFKELEIEVDMALLEARCGVFCLKAKYEGLDVAPRNFLPVGAPFGLQAKDKSMDKRPSVLPLTWTVHSLWTKFS